MLKMIKTRLIFPVLFYIDHITFLSIFLFHLLMPNHFDSIVIALGNEQDIKKFYDDFNASAIKFSKHPGSRLCICQFADPVPLCIYKGKDMNAEEREVAQKFGYSNLFDYAYQWWGVRYGCYDSTLIMHDQNTVVFRFWTSLGPISDRIFHLLHRKYPTLLFEYAGQDECDPELHNTHRIFLPTDPVLDVEEINRLHKEREEEKRRRFLFQVYGIQNNI